MLIHIPIAGLEADIGLLPVSGVGNKEVPGALHAPELYSNEVSRRALSSVFDIVAHPASSTHFRLP